MSGLIRASTFTNCEKSEGLAGKVDEMRGHGSRLLSASRANSSVRKTTMDRFNLLFIPPEFQKIVTRSLLFRWCRDLAPKHELHFLCTVLPFLQPRFKFAPDNLHRQ